MTTIETIGGFVLVIVLIFSMIVIYNNFFDQTEVDIAGFAACAARGVQAGGRGECSVDAACSGISVKSGEYASYLGVQCTGKEPGVEPNPSVPEKKYCCVIIPRYANPPAGTLAEGQIENNRNYCESTSPLVVGKAVGVITSDRGYWCFLSGHDLLKSNDGKFTIRQFPVSTTGSCTLAASVWSNNQHFNFEMSSPCASSVDFPIDLRQRASNVGFDLGTSGSARFGYSDPGAVQQIIVVPYEFP
jgi:hypothetical protein